MHTRTIITLWGITIGWAVLWIIMHFQRPGSFPWVGMPVGLLFVLPLFVNHWVEQRKEREKVKQRRQEEARRRKV